MKYMETAIVSSQEALAHDIYSMVITTEQIAKDNKKENAPVCYCSQLIPEKAETIMLTHKISRYSR